MGKFLATTIAAFLVGFLVTGLAIAANVHTVNNWEHGLGDGANNNSYVHPYNNMNLGRSDCSSLRLNGGSGLGWLWGQISCSSHNHVSWDTNPYSEGTFYSEHQMSGAYPVNLHIHYHD